MNWDRVEGNWKQFRGRVQEKWGKLTNDDLDRIQGNRKRLEGVLQERYGKGVDAIHDEVDEWSEAMDDDDAYRVSSVSREPEPSTREYGASPAASREQKNKMKTPGKAPGEQKTRR